MEIISVILLAIAVAMDAFAISICKGIKVKDKLNKNSAIVGLWFGSFQGVMPLIGYFFMDNVGKYVESIKVYIIFLLLLYIGVAMILEARKEEDLDASLDFKTMLLLSIATSLDALSVGMTISLLNINIFFAVSVIALITFLFSFFGVKIGSKFGNKYKTKAEVVGGIILILIGLKILLQYLF